MREVARSSAAQHVADLSFSASLGFPCGCGQPAVRSEPGSGRGSQTTLTTTRSLKASEPIRAS